MISSLLNPLLGYSFCPSSINSYNALKHHCLLCSLSKYLLHTIRISFQPLKPNSSKNRSSSLPPANSFDVLHSLLGQPCLLFQRIHVHFQTDPSYLNHDLASLQPLQKPPSVSHSNARYLSEPFFFSSLYFRHLLRPPFLVLRRELVIFDPL